MTIYGSFGWFFVLMRKQTGSNPIFWKQEFSILYFVFWAY
uniref:Uncharacterized protein n=1 Tax=Strigamia maritima TaxID=126957 RepID=T1JI52_STRMM